MGAKNLGLGCGSDKDEGSSVGSGLSVTTVWSLKGVRILAPHRATVRTRRLRKGLKQHFLFDL
jgi:hypothetical protein